MVFVFFVTRRHADEVSFVPHASVKLKPGVDQNETPALNETGISISNLIRFIYDRSGIGLIQKLGGWTKFFPNTISGIVRALWAWEDTVARSHLAVGTQNAPHTYRSQLSVITNGTQNNITPRASSDNITPVLSSTAGDSIVIITDSTTTGITYYDSVYIPAHISIGGVILFGLYACNPDGFQGTSTYHVQSLDTLGNPLAAPSTSTTAYVASFATTSGSSAISVTLPSHGYIAGGTYPILIPVTVGGVTLFGNYTIQSITSSSVFVIIGNNQASSTTTSSINGGEARYVYSLSFGPTPLGTGYGIGAYGSGGYGTGAVTTAQTGFAIAAKDWTLDNWGQILVACPVTSSIALTTTATSGTGSVGTITFDETYLIPVGESITVTGVVPTSWNGTYVVTSSTENTVSFASTATGAQTAAGTIAVESTLFAPVYVWDAEANPPNASAIPQSPPVNDGIFVAMPQRQIIAWGSSFTGILDPLLIRWCDVNNYNSWIGTVTNQAGSFRIPKGSKIVACIQGPQQGLIWTDLGVWSMQYIGPPYVYSFNEIGSGCGLIGRKAAASINGNVFWMGPSQFFSLSEGGVQPVPCPIWDVIFQDLDQTQLDKIRVAVNSRFGEITWYYPTKSSGGEINAYIKYNVYMQSWDFGSLARSAWIDQSVLGPPIGSDPNSGYLYQHETSPNADDQPLLASFRTGYFAMSDGDLKTFVDQVWPDMKWGYYGGTQNATVNMTFYVADYPGQTPLQFGPYPLTQSTTFITPRFRGRLVSIELSSSDYDSFWRIGNIRYRLQQDGKF